MCSGDAQGLSERRTMPSRFNWSNSSFAARNFSSSRRRNLEEMGGPEVLMWWNTSFVAGRGGSVLDVFTTSSNSLNNSANQTSKGWLMSTAVGRSGGRRGQLSGPALAGPALAGPALAGLALAAPVLAGPVLAGPALAAPALAGPAVAAPALAAPGVG